MSLQTLTAIAQLAAATAVIPSLIFVAYQVHQATNAVKASASQAHAAMFQALSGSIVDNREHFADIWRRGLRGTEALSDEERVRFFAFASSYLRFIESARLQQHRNQLDLEHWRAIERQATELANEPGIQEFWSARRNWHCYRFQDWFETLFQNAESARSPSRGHHHFLRNRNG